MKNLESRKAGTETGTSFGTAAGGGGSPAVPDSIDNPDYIARLAGLYRDCELLAQSAQTIVANLSRRLEAIRRNGFIRLAELGEELLRVQEQRPGEFDAWFALHRSRLGFSRRTAYRCKAAAQQVRDLGIEQAIMAALGESSRDRPEPFLLLRLSLPVSPEHVPADEIPALLERIRPAVEVYHALEERAAAPVAA